MIQILSVLKEKEAFQRLQLIVKRYQGYFKWVALANKLGRWF